MTTLQSGGKNADLYPSDSEEILLSQFPYSGNKETKAGRSQSPCWRSQVINGAGLNPRLSEVGLLKSNLFPCLESSLVKADVVYTQLQHYQDQLRQNGASRAHTPHMWGAQRYTQSRKGGCHQNPLPLPLIFSASWLHAPEHSVSLATGNYGAQTLRVQSPKIFPCLPTSRLPAPHPSTHSPVFRNL